TPAQAVALALAVDALPPGSPFGVDARTARDKVLDAMPATDRARAQALSQRLWTRPDAASADAAARVGWSRRAGTQSGASGPSDGGAQGSPARSSAPGVAAVASPGVLRAVEDALSRERVLAIEYVTVAGDASHRRVEPIVLTRTHGRWYLAAWCRTRDDVRWFRLDRVRRADVTAEPYDARPVAVVGAPPDDARPVGRRAEDD
ncbi:helix-turn-helix transcriptional regulator, partial [Cellulomonas algicola]|uniref:helix-turn-helix transcriptional regulator n=1 Tax=Cellulomonas algicola TaxID=2071633 RepID=UPI0011CF75EC